MKQIYEIHLTEEEMTELFLGYAVAYTLSREEPSLFNYAAENFENGNKEIQKQLATKIQNILQLKNNAKETI